MASPDGEEDPAKVNYRTMGRGHGGVLKRRRPRFVRDFSKPGTGTIPSNFETVLHRDNREARGFGHRATRFEAESRADELPGPGAYSGGAGGVGGVGGAGGGSVGQRGHGAFAARTPRQPGHMAAAPGPGAYGPAVPEQRGGALPSAAFVLPGSANPQKLYARPPPGPGDYAGERALSARGPGRGVGTRFAQAGAGQEGRPDQLQGQGGGPGPGQYDAAASPRASSLPPKGWTIGCSKRRLLPRAADVAEPPMQDLLRAGAEMIADKAPAASPGPGDYDPQARESPRHVSNRGLSCFQAGSSHMPRRWRPPSPGPGAYDTAAAAAEPTAAQARASFTSASPRFRDQAPPAPGPAYYNPRRQRQLQSFHLNMNGGWI